MLQKKKSGIPNRAWHLLRLALLWARKGGVFKHRLLLDLRLFQKFLKTSFIGQSSSQRDAIYYGERELSFDDSPIVQVKRHRPSSLRFRLPHVPCISDPKVELDFNFKYYGDTEDLSFSWNKYDIGGRKSFSSGGSDGDDEDCEVCEDHDDVNSCEDEGIDAKAEQFIAKFYEQVKMQRQLSYLQYNEMLN